MTHFSKVSEFNTIFDVDVVPHDETPLNLNMIHNNKVATLRYDLIYEEGILELKPAFDSNNRIEIADALADLLYVCYGALYAYSFDGDLLLREYAPYTISPSENLNLLIQNLESHSNQNNYYEPTTSYSPNDCMNRLIEMIENLKREFFTNKNIYSVKNILLRIIANTYNFAYQLNIPIDLVFDLVHRSNMSKICISEFEARLTVKTYEAK